jgi:hypothetical protein
VRQRFTLDEISGSQGGEYEDDCLVEIDWRFRGAYCLHHQGDDGAVSTAEPSVNYYQATRRNIPEDSHLQNFTPLQNKRSRSYFFRQDKRR